MTPTSDTLVLYADCADGFGAAYAAVIAAHYGGGGNAQASFTLPLERFFSEIWRR